MWPFTSRPNQPNEEARRLVAEGALLLDVRTPAEFASGHVDGALNIPVQELGARVSEVGPKDRAVVVYCRSGGRSCAAAGLLKNAGYDVLDVGGMASY
jgi:rhodanese-related sulfurtransferase